jgi:hypothetical protein
MILELVLLVFIISIAVFLYLVLTGKLADSKTSNSNSKCTGTKVNFPDCGNICKEPCQNGKNYCSCSDSSCSICCSDKDCNYPNGTCVNGFCHCSTNYIGVTCSSCPPGYEVSPNCNICKTPCPSGTSYCSCSDTTCKNCCSDKDCNYPNGTCVNGFCQCNNNYSGFTCSNPISIIDNQN